MNKFQITFWLAMLFAAALVLVWGLLKSNGRDL